MFSFSGMKILSIRKFGCYKKNVYGENAVKYESESFYLSTEFLKKNLQTKIITQVYTYTACILRGFFQR